MMEFRNSKERGHKIIFLNKLIRLNMLLVKDNLERLMMVRARLNENEFIALINREIIF